MPDANPAVSESWPLAAPSTFGSSVPPRGNQDDDVGLGIRLRRVCVLLALPVINWHFLST
jgi:hypothetical protein